MAWRKAWGAYDMTITLSEESTHDADDPSLDLDLSLALRPGCARARASVGVLRDNAGAPVSEGDFEMTPLYESLTLKNRSGRRPEARLMTRAKTHPRCVAVNGGMFRLMLGDGAAPSTPRSSPWPVAACGWASASR